MKIRKFNINGLVHKLPVLKLHPLLVEAMKAGKLNYTHALELKKLKDETVMKKLLDEVFATNMTLRTLKDKVHKLLDHQHPVHQNPFSGISAKIKLFYKLPPEKQSVIKEKVKEIMALLVG